MFLLVFYLRAALCAIVLHVYTHTGSGGLRRGERARLSAFVYFFCVLIIVLLKQCSC